MTYIIICFLCIIALALLAIAAHLNIARFNIKPLALPIGIAAFVCFYIAQSNGEIHIISVRMARWIVAVVQWFC